MKNCSPCGKVIEVALNNWLRNASPPNQWRAKPCFRSMDSLRTIKVLKRISPGNGSQATIVPRRPFGDNSVSASHAAHVIASHRLTEKNAIASPRPTNLGHAVRSDGSGFNAAGRSGLHDQPRGRAFGVFDRHAVPILPQQAIAAARIDRARAPPFDGAAP